MEFAGLTIKLSHMQSSAFLNFLIESIFSVKLDGRMLPTARAAVINAFNTNPKIVVFLVSLKVNMAPTYDWSTVICKFSFSGRRSCSQPDVCQQCVPYGSLVIKMTLLVVFAMLIHFYAFCSGGIQLLKLRLWTGFTEWARNDRFKSSVLLLKTASSLESFSCRKRKICSLKARFALIIINEVIKCLRYLL
jgi:hypothetical protein